jgi:hypothetical protein
MRRIGFALPMMLLAVGLAPSAVAFGQVQGFPFETGHYASELAFSPAGGAFAATNAGVGNTMSATVASSLIGSWHGLLTQYAPSGTRQRIEVSSQIVAQGDHLAGQNSEITVQGSGGGTRCAGRMRQTAIGARMVAFAYTETLDPASCIAHTAITFTSLGAGKLAFDETYETNIGPGQLVGQLVGGPTTCARFHDSNGNSVTVMRSSDVSCGMATAVTRALVSSPSASYRGFKCTAHLAGTQNGTVVVQTFDVTCAKGTVHETFTYTSASLF